MGWSVGYDDRWKRDIGYGVPATCDRPGCGKDIDRGLAFVCGGEPFGGEQGCGLFFCEDDLLYGDAVPHTQLCDRCRAAEPPFDPAPDTREWIGHKLADESWRPWRDENPEAVAVMRHGLAQAGSR